MLVKTERKSARKRGETRGRKRMVTVSLRLQHRINGRPYGPGDVVVREDLAIDLRSQEQQFKNAEQFLYQQGSAIIGAGNRLIRLPAERFNDALGSTISGAGAGFLVRT